MSENSEEYFSFKATDFANKLSLYVRALFESKQNCDSLFFGENDGKVRAHRLILDATIPGLITPTDLQHGIGNNCGLNATNDDRNAMFVCRLPLKIETITKITKFCYTGEISIANDELAPLLKFSIHYNVKELIDVCSNRLKKSIDPNSFNQVIEHWKKADNDLELGIWREIICSNFLKISKYPTFGDITIDQFENILRSNDLTNIREEEIFNAFLVWLEKPNNVSAHLDIGSILTHMRFPLMNLKFFSENVEKLLEQFNRVDLIAEYYKWNHAQSKSIDMTTKISNQRMSLRGNDLIILTIKTNNKLLMQIVPPQPGKPITRCEIASLKFNEYNSIVHMNDNKLIISGGTVKYKRNKGVSTVTGFDLKIMQKMEYPPLQTPRSSHASIVINEDIYVAGGYSSTNTLNSVEKYCHINKKWSFVKSMIQNRMTFSLVAVNGYIYALGGRVSSNTTMLKSVERYDPSLNTWTEVPSMKYSRAGLSAVAHNNNIYVFGGAQKIKQEGKNLWYSDLTHEVEKYNAVTDSWSTIYTMNTARMDIISCLYGEYIILVGGFDEEKDEDVKTIQVFDTERLEFSYLNSLEDILSCGVAFSAPMDLVDKLKKHQFGTNFSS